jgi:peptidoglycan LD-endopeptidase CwlK
MAYVLGSRSLRMLQGVDDRIVHVVKRAIELTKQDFSVFEGLRTKKRQSELMSSGASKTLNSRHLTGDAVDLVPYIAGQIRWERVPCFTIAEAIRQASLELRVPIRWGGCWTTELQLKPAAQSYESFATGWDFVHFELPWRMNDEVA